MVYGQHTRSCLELYQGECVCEKVLYILRQAVIYLTSLMYQELVALVALSDFIFFVSESIFFFLTNCWILFK